MLSTQTPTPTAPAPAAAAPAAGPALSPYGLRCAQRLPAHITLAPDLAYCPHRQQTLAGGRPLAERPDLLAARSVTWGTTDRDNKTDNNG
ncbi:hypothetical protein [Actinomadura litoris]|uniref:Uncharacterized protein n=1 Tax=Actinomadura litoris TaxID=2678616 RepID=A0A7K1LBJ9_9ACTN|nr:hypothetical protein [Actinomadura litoris]MUN41693.1 hypothetical protein [Actinomadura litoris]